MGSWTTAARRGDADAVTGWLDVLEGRTRIAVVEGDCVEVMRAVPEASVDALPCGLEVYAVPLAVHVARMAEGEDVPRRVRVVRILEGRDGADVVNVEPPAWALPAAFATPPRPSAREAPQDAPVRAVVWAVATAPRRVALAPLVEADALHRAEAARVSAVAGNRALTRTPAEFARDRYSSRSQPLRLARGLYECGLACARVAVGPCHDARHDARAAGGVVAAARTEDAAMARLQLRRGTHDGCAAGRAGEGIASAKVPGCQGASASVATRQAVTVVQARPIDQVEAPADRAVA